MIKWFAAALLALPAAASAQSGPALPSLAPPGPALPGPALHANYAAYYNGLNVVAMSADMALTPRTYTLEITFRTTGALGTLVRVQGDTRVDGAFGAGRPMPRSLFSTGTFRGVPRVTRLRWQGGRPEVLQMEPPIAEDDRDPVPEADQAGTVDSLSAIAQLLHDVAANGRCDGTVNTFDGRRLADLTTHTVGMEDLPQTSRSSFHGPALRCDFVGHQIGGFVHDANRADLQKPQEGSAWFASVRPGEPPIPVRFVFQTRYFGPATAYLTD